MVTATYQDEDQRLYADGVLVSRSQCTGARPPNFTDVLIGGMDFGPYRHPWIGDVDEVSIYDKILSAEEIKVLYRSEH